MIRHLKKLDWILIVASFLLVGIGLLSLHSSSLQGEDFSNFKKQLIFFGIAVFLMFLFSFFDYHIFRNDPYLILMLYLFCCLALLGLFFFAPDIRGVKSWYRVGPLSIDPVELTKIVLILLLAKYFSMRHVELYRVRHILLSGLYILAPTTLIFFQPDLGQVLIIFSLWLAILLISGIKLRTFLILMLCLILLVTFSWLFLLKDYQKERISTFLLPQFEPLGAGWSRTQAQITIGSGGMSGQGLGQGSQTQYGFLPEPQTDFIYAAIAEEFGFWGVSVLFLLFLVLIWRIIKIALKSQTNFPRLFASGFAILLFSQIFIHIGMNLGILPIVGIPLPLVSYGGSSLIATYIGLGILQNTKIR